MGAVTGWTPNILVATPGAIPTVVSMGQVYVEMEHKGRGIKPHAHGRKRRRRSRR